jgi:hypothetical protein
MDMGAISAVVPGMDTGSPALSKHPGEIAREFDALLWQMVIGEVHLFGTDSGDETTGGLGPMSAIADQILAAQLAKGLELGLGRAVLASAVGETNR